MIALKKYLFSDISPGSPDSVDIDEGFYDVSYDEVFSTTWEMQFVQNVLQMGVVS